MMHVKSLDEGLDVFKALGSDVRIEIIKLLIKNKGMNMNSLAAALNITNGALTSHVKKLEDCGIITVVNESAGHGNQKKCMVHLNKILVEFGEEEKQDDVYETEIKVGQYSDYQVFPTCGLATPAKIIGEVDDARYFAHPERVNSDILWFTRGYVEYMIPNLVPASHRLTQLTISAELSSEAPGVNSNWPSDLLLPERYVPRNVDKPRGFRGCEGVFYSGLVVQELEPVRPAEAYRCQRRRNVYRRA